MYCPQCGEQNSEVSNFCKKCGAALTQPKLPQRPTKAEAGRRISSFALPAFFLGIIAFYIKPLAILAIIFGAIAISQTGKDRSLRGRDIAIIGMVLGIIVAAWWIIARIWFGKTIWWLF